ncbi:malate dehydrogenase (quinone) [Virgibacillus oceani]
MDYASSAPNVILIGTGIVSATLGTLLNKLEPDWHITILEKLETAGEESSNEWNNAGTGHAAFCELNYTPENQDGSIDIDRAVEINEQFHVSQQFWSYLVEENKIYNPEEFIQPLPHISFVYGEKNKEYLKKRYEKLSTHPQFQGIEFSDNHGQLKEWLPLMMKGRTTDETLAATKVSHGTDVNFGELTRKLLGNLENQNNVDIHYNHKVTDISQTNNKSWEVNVHDFKNNMLKVYTADFVFIGAGGGALPLLQKTRIPESKRIGGFPISGEFLVCNNPEVIKQHDSKVYGKEPPGTPPMTVPHLDRRHINGEDTLLYGPFAGFSPKFLKSGSYTDLLASVKPNNIFTMLAAAGKNISMIRYLAQQLMMSKEQKMRELQKFVPNAKSNDWEILVAGQRVQVIKDTDTQGKGALQFGTELIHSEDLSLAALLGESPGASVSVSIMLEVLGKCFPQYSDKWKPYLKEMIPSYGEKLADNPELIEKIIPSTMKTLKLYN